MRSSLPRLILLCVLLTLASPLAGVLGVARAQSGSPPLYIAFLWHMHQPIYWPYESPIATDAQSRYDYSVVDIHVQRTGPYTTWPWDAVQLGVNAGFAHFGAQVSFSGSLMENLDAIESAGNPNFLGWKNRWLSGAAQLTSQGNPRMDLVAFGYHHPLMALIDPGDIRRQIQAHRTRALAMGGGISRGIFPPENAFSSRMIPALVDEGIQWVLVDNIHFDRACAGYPYSSAGNLMEPNRSDVRNPDPSDWVSLTGVWAPTPISARFGHLPHWVQSVDPQSGATSRMIAVPTDRYLGNEDGRGGFGALDYEGVLSQLEAYNTDPSHPLLVVLHHDGDNYGGGSDSYYHYNFQAFVDWLQANPQRFVCTTVQDYLDLYPPETTDVIHVENGSWSGADNGDPEFSKWLGDPAPDGYSPDRNSWSVMTAARNEVLEADAADPTANATQEAWRYFLNGEASDYWYWDGAQNGIWDSHPTRAANLAVAQARSVNRTTADLVAPSLFPPQREPYNPGATEWGVVKSNDFEVWTFASDARGLSRVTLFFREDLDGVNSASSTQNETYAGGNEVGAWQSLAMSASQVAPRTDPLPTVSAQRYSAVVSGLNEVLVDYYVEAEDLSGNVARGSIEHVFVGSASTGGGSSGFVLDGVLDGQAEEVSPAGGVDLHLAYSDGILYLATTAASSLGEDVLVLVSESPGALVAAPWAKAGQVPQWNVYLGNESGNGWSGWFDAPNGAGASTAGQVLEGTLDLSLQYTTLPTSLYLAVARYSTEDNGTLLAQFPAGNGDGDIAAAELYRYDLPTATDANAVQRRVPLSLRAHPNPFNPMTTLEFTLAQRSFVRLELYDLKGRKLRTLLSGVLDEGLHQKRLQATGLASGVYFARLWTPRAQTSERVVLVK